MSNNEKPQLSPIAQSILTVITESTKPPRGSYIAGWNICDQLGVSRTELHTSHDTKYDKALKELINAGIIEELPNLGCRYRLCKQEKPKQLSMLDALKDPDYDLYQEREGDQEILQGLNARLRYYDDLLTDIG